MKNLNLLVTLLCFTLFFGTHSHAQVNLDLEGQVKIIDGNEAAGKVLTSDANGDASWQTPAGITYAVGDFAQGGIVFWVDETGQHGLVCAKEDQSTGIRWYAGDSTNTMARCQGPFSGEMNTTLIVANQGFGDGNNYAALLCSTLDITEGGKTYGDWFLPSWDAAILLYTLRTTIDATATANGGTALNVGGFYWSSYEFDFNDPSPSESAMAVWFAASGGGPDAHGKNEMLRVRAVRAF
jgi:hypothetical protein